ncbi:MAG: hypothetical protein ABI598_07580 [Chloroflexota bacterium]
MTAPAPELRILVCGAGDRGDDRAPMAAISQILPALPSGLRSRIEVRRCPQLDVTDVINVAEGETCLVIDTVVGIEPGSIVRLSLVELARRAGGIAPRSTHALSIDDTLQVAEAVRGSLPPGAFVGIGGRWFGYGERFSRSVTAGLPALCTAIREAVEELLPVFAGDPVDGMRDQPDGASGPASDPGSNPSTDRTGEA